MYHFFLQLAVLFPLQMLHNFSQDRLLVTSRHRTKHVEEIVQCLSEIWKAAVCVSSKYLILRSTRSVQKIRELCP